ncbi:MAG: heme-binding protein [Alphaproteobacteria bacterium]
MPEIIEKKSIGEALARKLIRGAYEEADKIGIPMAIAVCDENGLLKTFIRMDGAPYMSNEVAINKAKTAASFGMPTHEWYDAIKSDPGLTLGAPHITDFVTFGGGFPIVVDGQTAGGIGVSGGSVAEDMRCAEAAITLLSGGRATVE